mgnify:CR=1 FL=1|jgi:hypothetical protein
MRSISEDDVLALLTNHHFDNDKGNFDLLIHNLCKEVRRIPTAYDPDKVVEQLEEFQGELDLFGCSSILPDMIDVVARGGVDGN